MLGIKVVEIKSRKELDDFIQLPYAIYQTVRNMCQTYLDSILKKFDAVVIRRSAILVAEEVAEARRMEEDMQQQVRAQLRAEKKQEFKDKIQQKQEQIKADFEVFLASFKRKG